MLHNRTMIITFADGRQEKYKFTHQEVNEGEVHFWTEYAGAIGYRRHNEYYIPLDKILIRKVEDDW